MDRAEPRTVVRYGGRSLVPQHGCHHPGSRSGSDGQGADARAIKAARVSLDFDGRYGSTTGAWAALKIPQSFCPGAGATRAICDGIAVRDRADFLRTRVGMVLASVLEVAQRSSAYRPRSPADRVLYQIVRRRLEPIDRSIWPERRGCRSSRADNRCTGHRPGARMRCARWYRRGGEVPAAATVLARPVAHSDWKN